MKNWTYCPWKGITLTCSFCLSSVHLMTESVLGTGHQVQLMSMDASEKRETGFRPARSREEVELSSPAKSSLFKTKKSRDHRHRSCRGKLKDKSNRWAGVSLWLNCYSKIFWFTMLVFIRQEMKMENNSVCYFSLSLSIITTAFVHPTDQGQITWSTSNTNTILLESEDSGYQIISLVI